MARCVPRHSWLPTTPSIRPTTLHIFVGVVLAEDDEHPRPPDEPTVLTGTRVLLISPEDYRRDVVARRLRAQGCSLEETADPSDGAELALASPPSVVVADLWMPQISGVQLCRLLRSEPATADVPVLLCGDDDAPRNRFWAERAGAAAYVVKGRTGDLVRAVAQASRGAPTDDAFFEQLPGGGIDIRDRIARHLDEALFESVIASEVRALASAGGFERLFDRLAQLMSQLTRYRWVALTTFRPARVAIHHHPNKRELASQEARSVLGIDADVAAFYVEDEDAAGDAIAATDVVCDVHFGGLPVARFAMSPTTADAGDAHALARIVGQELGGAVRMADLVEESQRLAATDGLTNLTNRRAFTELMHSEIARCNRYGGTLSLMLLDLDHFKRINDERGHAAGDRVLAALGDLLRRRTRESDHTARWGGEEFVVALTVTDEAAGRIAAERVRRAIEEVVVHDDRGARIPLSASIGLAGWRTGETLEALVARADAAMYASKAGGRNRVTVDLELVSTDSESAPGPAMQALKESG